MWAAWCVWMYFRVMRRRKCWNPITQTVLKTVWWDWDLSERHYKQRERESEQNSKCYCCLPTNLPSRPSVVKMWWLKANVRSYVELSSAIREHLLPPSWLRERWGERKEEWGEARGASKHRERMRPYRGKKKVLLRHFECWRVTGWRLQHINF